MRSMNIIKKALSLLTISAMLTSFSMVALAGSGYASAEITTSGQVSVNGAQAASGSTIVSGSTVTTGSNSSATISLGKAGRVELGANSGLTINFSASDMAVVLSTGKARFMNAAGVATTVAAKSATVLADSSQSNSFAVEVECAHTHVDTVAGLVTMRSGDSDKPVVAGTNAIAGNPTQAGCQPCYRPDCCDVATASVSALPIATILLLVGGIIGTAIIIGSGENESTGTATVISPVR